MQLNFALDAVFTIFNGKLVPWILSGGILLFGFVMYWKFRSLLRPVTQELDSATSMIKKYRAGEISFDTLSDKFEHSPSLQNSWDSLRKALIVQKDNLNGRISMLMPQDISQHFTETSILAPAINLRFYQGLPNMLVGVGLFFTFVGLVMALYFASQGVTAPNVEEAQRALKDLLDAATFKFLTSLAGLLASLVFSWREKTVLHQAAGKIDALVLSLDAAFSRTSLETLAFQRNGQMQKHESILQQQLDEARQQTAQLKRFETDFALSIANAIDQRLTPRLEHLANTLLQPIELLSLKIGTVNEEAIRRMTEDFRKTLTNGACTEISRMSDVINTLSDRLESSGSSLESKLKGAGKDIAEGAEGLGNVLFNLKTGVVDLGHIVKSATENADRTTSLLSQNVEVLWSLHTALGQTLTRLSDTGQTIDTTAKTLDNSIQNLVSYQETTATQIQAMSDASRLTLTSIEESGRQVQSVSESLQGTWTSCHGRLESFDEHLEKTFNIIEKLTSLHFDLDQQWMGALHNLCSLIEKLNDSVDKQADTARHRN